MTHYTFEASRLKITHRRSARHRFDGNVEINTNALIRQFQREHHHLESMQFNLYRLNLCNVVLPSFESEL